VTAPTQAGTFNQAQYDDFLAKSGDVYAQSKYRVLLRWMSGRGRLRVLNAGCGSGELSCLVAAAGHRVVGIDPDPTYIRLARERAGDRFPDSQFLVSSIEGYSGPGDFDAAVSTDVLEHIEDDRTAFEKVAALVRPGGLILVTVPAGQWLFGYHDEQLGHYRRYSKRTLRRLVSGACTVKKLRYFGGTLVPVCLAYSKWLRKPYPVAKVGGGASPVSRVLDGMLALERRVPLPLGTSVLLCAERKAQAAAAEPAPAVTTRRAA
jgi:2-polyprenyl-3-methyl-5-hydroxy-6-metoxy-1,4-benzoquinol methylase